MNYDKNSIFSHLDTSRPHEAFENAISKGLKNPQDYMYMYSDANYDYFKHGITRHYIEFRRKNTIIDKIKKVFKNVQST